jgi:hypothetical protein
MITKGLKLEYSIKGTIMTTKHQSEQGVRLIRFVRSHFRSATNQLEPSWGTSIIRPARYWRTASTLLLCILATTSMHAQVQNRYAQAQLTTDLFQSITTGVSNIQIAARTKRWGLGLSGTYMFTERLQNGFTTEVEMSGCAIHGLAYFPLHCTRPQKRSLGAVPCPSWGPRGKNKPGKECLSGSVYLQVGYRKDRIQYLLRQEQSEGIVGPSYLNSITIPGVDMRLGYAIQYWRITVEVGYGAFIGSPKLEGKIDLFGDELYTGTHPFPYLLQTAPDLRVGCNIPIVRN